MDARIGGEAHHFYNSDGQRFVVRENRDLDAYGKKSFEWDLNDWRWDGDLFIARPSDSNSVPPDCRSRQLIPLREQIQVSNSSSACSDETNAENGKEKTEFDKRRRPVEGSLTLDLGGHGYPIAENFGVKCDEKNGKKSKMSGGASSNRAVCQVENCGADLSIAKDYHRRHKVCEMHSKASKAIVANVMQRFCQQCSRFHVLQEFDEGKRSCRRRLAGHNRRRRKTHPEVTVNGGSSIDDQSSNYLLISLIRILSNMHSNNSCQAEDQDILSHLLRNLANVEGLADGQNMSGIIQESKVVAGNEATAGTSSDMRLVSNSHETSRLGSASPKNKVVDAQGHQVRTVNQNLNSASEVPEKAITVHPEGVLQTMAFLRNDRPPAKAHTSDFAVGRSKLNKFDLNNAYTDTQEFDEGLDNSQLCTNVESGSLDLPMWMQKDSHQSNPPQTSANSDSLTGQSLSSSGGDAQSRTDRIVFKLFGKSPSHFPVGLRSQILNWLSHSPTDIESYIRPGCIILTIYLRLAESTWQKLQDDLSSSLSRLLNGSDDAFWRTGWVYTRVQHRIAFIHNGQIVLDTPLPLTIHNHSRIASVTPIAVSISDTAQFLVKGYNFSRPTSRLLCALEGKYLFQEATSSLLDTGALEDHNEIQSLSFPCSVPDVSGRGFLEVEDDGLSSGFFPFVVAEQDVCLEIRMLESAVEFTDDAPGSADRMKLKNQALEFIHEMGWLLRRSRLRARLDRADSNSDIFPFTRFRWLVEFSVDHGWCAVVKKLLDILFDGYVGSGEHLSVELALLELGLLHRAVRRRNRQMVELLLRYVPNKASDTAGSELKEPVRSESDKLLFRPDAVGPAGLTPLHIAASSDASESLLDALTDDPGLVGVKAWKTIRDNTGSTPEDYARLKRHYSYIHLVHKKVQQSADMGHVVVDIPSVVADFTSNLKQTGRPNPAKVTGFEIDGTEMRSMKMLQPSCKVCDQQVGYRKSRGSLVYRPAMLSMLAIAAVCVCVSLIFKSSPEVEYVYPFRWELLEFGSI